jgi:hypothetical protein
MTEEFMSIDEMREEMYQAFLKAENPPDGLTALTTTIGAILVQYGIPETEVVEYMEAMASLGADLINKYAVDE